MPSIHHDPRPADAALARLLRRDRTIVLGMLAVVAAVAWIYTLAGGGMQSDGRPGDMAGMGGMAGMEPPFHPLVLFAMWWVMMVAMMLPAAAPMILLFAAVERRRQNSRPPVRTLLFAASYLVVWGGFSALAAGAQYISERAGLLGPRMALSGQTASGVLLIAAGLYQLTPMKNVCLRNCRDPVRFLAEHWHPGLIGSLRMGLAHGAYCLGCCWLLMFLLFVGGVMNPLWIGGLALLVLVEKLAPFGPVFRQLAGVALVAAGIWLVAGAAGSARDLVEILRSG